MGNMICTECKTNRAVYFFKKPPCSPAAKTKAAIPKMCNYCMAAHRRRIRALNRAVYRTRHRKKYLDYMREWQRKKYAEKTKKYRSEFGLL